MLYFIYNRKWCNVIELKDIKKTYKSKKGLPTEALKGVNIKFGDKGLCFVLGKSGSGKSTLLNILGGLDNYTSGDIIINGKSTKNFTETDWDAYRNTYIGFIFQEFNLLDNYTVEDNIKLSLELQGKKCSEEEVKQALRMVELDDVLKRKPNELSGGQKQRIAIARALIKNPEIILADEPTGNLDSETSKQIFGVLKILSKRKLVVVVSHDEESAKKYADRIINISDGFVVSDNNECLDEVKHELKLVNAKLPFIYSFKMGIGNLFHKKFKLFFSVILIVLCLVCFGIVTSTLSLDINKEYIKVFEENGPVDVYIRKYKEKMDYEEYFLNTLKNISNSEDLSSLEPKLGNINADFINEVKQKTNMSWYAEYKVVNNFESLAWLYNSNQGEADALYYYIGNAPIAKEIKLVEYSNEIINESKLIGKVPVGDDEIVISSFIADQIIHNGISGKKEKTQQKVENYKPSSYDELINDGNYINFGGMFYVKVSGIIDYKNEMMKYSKLKEIKTSKYFDMLSGDEYKQLNSLYGDLINNCDYLLRVFVNNSFIEKINLKEENKSNSSSKVMIDNKFTDVDLFGYILNNIDVINSSGREKITSLKENEVIINTYMLNQITGGNYEKKLEESILSGYYSDDLTFIKSYIKDNNIINKKIKSSICNNKIYNDSDNYCEYEIIGVIHDNIDYGMIYYNKDNISKLISNNLSINSLFRRVNNVNELEKILMYYPVNGSDVISSSTYSSGLISALVTSSLFKFIGKYGVIVFLIFSVLLLMNFISNSIKFRKKEIGTLRAIGCRSNDVIMMFVYECLTLMIICLLIAFSVIPKFVKAINNLIVSAIAVNVDILKFGINQMVGVSVIMIAIVTLASIIPIRKLTKTKPIDTILDK